jgi:hypothetical protein
VWRKQLKDDEIVVSYVIHIGTTGASGYRMIDGKFRNEEYMGSVEEINAET